MAATFTINDINNNIIEYYLNEEDSIKYELIYKKYYKLSKIEINMEYDNNEYSDTLLKNISIEKHNLNEMIRLILYKNNMLKFYTGCSSNLDCESCIAIKKINVFPIMMNQHEFEKYTKYSLTRPINIQWNNENIGFDLQLQKGYKCYHEIYYRSGDNKDDENDIKAIHESLYKLDKYEKKCFMMCPSNNKSESIRIYTSYNITVNILHTGIYLLFNLIHSKCGQYHIN